MVGISGYMAFQAIDWTVWSYTDIMSGDLQGDMPKMGDKAIVGRYIIDLLLPTAYFAASAAAAGLATTKGKIV